MASLYHLVSRSAKLQELYGQSTDGKASNQMGFETGHVTGYATMQTMPSYAPPPESGGGWGWSGAGGGWSSGEGGGGWNDAESWNSAASNHGSGSGSGWSGNGNHAAFGDSGKKSEDLWLQPTIRLNFILY